jgi:hypothetical protein
MLTYADVCWRMLSVVCVSIRQHASQTLYVSIRRVSIRQHTSQTLYVSIRRVSIRQHTSQTLYVIIKYADAYCMLSVCLSVVQSVCLSAYVSIRQHTSQTHTACCQSVCLSVVQSVCRLRQHTSAYVASAYVSIRRRRILHAVSLSVCRPVELTYADVC